MYYVLLFISIQYLLYMTYIAIQTHMNVHVCVQWNGMPTGYPYMELSRTRDRSCRLP